MDIEKENLKNSLSTFLYSSIIRTLSLKNSGFSRDDFKNIIHKYDEYVTNFNKEGIGFNKDIDSYLFSSMQNNGLMKYPLMNTLDLCNEGNSNRKYDLINHENKKYDLFKGIYPRFIKFNEFILFEINNQLFNNEFEVKEGDDEGTNNIIDDNGFEVNVENNELEEYIDNAIKSYNYYNFHSNNNYLYDKIEPKCLKKCIENCKLDYCKSNIINIKSNKKDSIKVGLINVKLFKENFVSRLKNSPNLSYKRFDSIKKIINDAIKNEVELLLMPEMYIPYEWVDAIVKISKDHQMAIIFGVEPILNGNAVGNYIMATFPFLVSEKYYESLLIYRIKNHYANEELKMFMKYDKNPNIVVNPKYYLVLWHDIFIAPYYCFEIANIHDRGLFKSCCDIVTVSEFNKDTNYFNNIAESLSRDLFCYCIKTNTSEFGGACILQPASSEKKYLVNLKGGDDDYIVTHELDIKKLREDAIKKDIYSDDSYFKPKPPGFDMDIVKHRMNLD